VLFEFPGNSDLVLDTYIRGIMGISGMKFQL
jgi:hypothetical protein